jgi:hypothetical protein
VNLFPGDPDLPKIGAVSYIFLTYCYYMINSDIPTLARLLLYSPVTATKKNAELKINVKGEGKMEQQTQTKVKSEVVNGVNVDELFGTINAVKAAPVIAKFRFRAENE